MEEKEGQPDTGKGFGSWGFSGFFWVLGFRGFWVQGNARRAGTFRDALLPLAGARCVSQFSPAKAAGALER